MTDPSSPEKSTRSARHVSIRVLLVSTIGGLVAMSVASVLLISAYANFTNTWDLIFRSSTQLLDSLDRELNSQMRPARDLVAFLSRRIGEGSINIRDRDQLEPAMIGAMAAAPQIGSVAILYPTSRMLRTVRAADGRVYLSSSTIPSAEVAAYTGRAHKTGEIIWGKPFHDDGVSLMTVLAPLYRNGAYIGAIGAGISVRAISRSFQTNETSRLLTPFVLYGRDKVVSHRNLPFLKQSRLPGDSPLHGLDELGDPVLANLFSSPVIKASSDSGFETRRIKADGVWHIVLTRKVTAYGQTPWYVGIYGRQADLDQQIRRLRMSIMAGLGLLVLSILAAVFLAHRISRPIRGIARASMKVSQLDLAQIRPLPPSRITELNDQSRSFNTMLDGLRWFETYLPRTLVNRLIRQGSGNQAASREAELTVMFTDLAGFTARSENMPPAEVAAMLNRHFEIINTCIEETGGTLDKYIGDAVMAFWGAPGHQDDHAERAARTALLILERMRAAQEKEGNGAYLRIKIGIHSGPLIVGNIGAKGRMNYTVIGDTVNTASRIEGLAGQCDDPSAPVIILMSDTTARKIRAGYALTKAGEFHVKGRSQPVRLWWLTGYRS